MDAKNNNNYRISSGAASNRALSGSHAAPELAHSHLSRWCVLVTDHELHITLAPLSSPHRTRAAQALCEMLDQTATIFPGSRLRIRFAVRPPPRIGLAFPGSPAERSTATAVAQVP